MSILSTTTESWNPQYIIVNNRAVCTYDRLREILEQYTAPIVSFGCFVKVNDEELPRFYRKTIDLVKLGSVTRAKYDEAYKKCAAVADDTCIPRPIPIEYVDIDEFAHKVQEILSSAYPGQTIVAWYI